MQCAMLRKVLGTYVSKPLLGYTDCLRTGDHNLTLSDFSLAQNYQDTYAIGWENCGPYSNNIMYVLHAQFSA